MTKELNGLKINYICEGEGDPVLLLHGWGANIGLFADLIALLSKKYKVLALDMPGHGESQEPPEAWEVDDYVDFVLDFLKDYEFEKITLLGHSFGGRVIIKMCARELPFSVEKVILVDAAGVKPEKTPLRRAKEGVYSAVKHVVKKDTMEKIFPHLMESMRRRNGSADYNAASPVMRETLVKVVNEDLCDLMPCVKCPTLLIWGTADTATPLSDGQTMEKLMPESALVTFEGAGHFSFLEQPQRFLRVIASFMNIQ